MELIDLFSFIYFWHFLLLFGLNWATQAETMFASCYFPSFFHHIGRRRRELESRESRQQEGEEQWK